MNDHDEDDDEAGPWSVRFPPTEQPAGAAVVPRSDAVVVLPPGLRSEPHPPPAMDPARRRSIPEPSPSSSGFALSDHPPPSVRRYRGPDSIRPRPSPDSMGLPAGSSLQAATFKFARYIPLLDPDAFSDIDFYQDLETIGYRQVLIGGTGAADVGTLSRLLKAHTKLTTLIYPSGPESVAPADLVVLPDVMNSNAPHARPFGTAAIATAMNVAQRGLPFVPVAYFVMGKSTAGWYFDTFPITSKKVLRSYATYARMVGYRYLALDYEGCPGGCDLDTITMLSQIEGLHILVSEDMTPDRALQVLARGAGTVITSSDMFEEAEDPFELAAEFYQKILCE